MKQIILALAAGFTAFASAFNAVAEDTEPDTTGGGEPSAPAGEPAKRRGRPPGGGGAGSAPSEPATGAPASVKTYEELREIIKPLVEGGDGDNVRKIIAKYGADLKSIPADKQAAFIKDIDALKY